MSLLPLGKRIPRIRKSVSWLWSKMLAFLAFNLLYRLCVLMLARVLANLCMHVAGQPCSCFFPLWWESGVGSMCVCARLLGALQLHPAYYKDML